MNENNSNIFKKYKFNNKIEVKNRLAMAPMTTWAANEDGSVSDEEIEFYRRRVNGVGLVITGTTYVSKNGIGFQDQFGGWDDKFIPSLTNLANATKSGGATAILQVFHAGNRALSNEDVVGATSLPAPAGPFNEGDVPTRALEQEEINQIIKDFGETIRRAIEAGFDGVELHGAHGFLIQNFFSPLYNQRDDEWGGSLENRMRFPLAVVEEAKRVIAKHSDKPFILGYRFSPEEVEEGGLRVSESLQLIDMLIEKEVDYVHASLNDVLNFCPTDSDDTQTTAEVICKHVNGRVPVLVAGAINKAEDAQKAIDLGADIVAIGKALVINPEWVELAENGKIDEIEFDLDLSKADEKAIPGGLIDIIKALQGWFTLSKEPELS